MELKYKMSVEQGWMQTELTKAHLASTTKAHDTERMAEVKIHDTQIKAHTARDVAEIHGATQLLNTNTEAAHDRAAARQMIDNAAKAESEAH